MDEKHMDSPDWSRLSVLTIRDIVPQLWLNLDQWLGCLMSSNLLESLLCQLIFCVQFTYIQIMRNI